MGKRLAGVCLIKNAVSLDYCVEASIRSMLSVADHVIVVYIESNDGTYDLLTSLKGVEGRLTILKADLDKWNNVVGKAKLSVFQNYGIEYAEQQGYEYVLLIQGDECLSESSVTYINRALELGEEAYYCTRHNMWKDEKHVLSVPQSRKPCSSVVNRLTKSYFRSIDDGEGIASTTASLDFINLIEIWHVGFIRNPKKHIAKIKEIQQNIFQMDYDKRADLKDEFDWRDWGFTEKDLIPIEKKLPKYLKEWVDKNKEL